MIELSDIPQSRIFDFQSFQRLSSLNQRRCVRVFPDLCVGWQILITLSAVVPQLLLRVELLGFKPILGAESSLVHLVDPEFD